MAHARRLDPAFTVMAGGGVRPDNVEELLAATGVSEIHSSASRCTAKIMMLMGQCAGRS